MFTILKSFKFYAVLLLLIVITAVIYLKQRVQILKNDINNINREISIDRDAIHVLQAEWAYLSNPSRIKQLADSYLSLSYVKTSQIRDQQYLNMLSQYSENVPQPQAKPILTPIKSSFSY